MTCDIGLYSGLSCQFLSTCCNLRRDRLISQKQGWLGVTPWRLFATYSSIHLIPVFPWRCCGAFRRDAFCRANEPRQTSIRTPIHTGGPFRGTSAPLPHMHAQRHPTHTRGEHANCRQKNSWTLEMQPNCVNILNCFEKQPIVWLLLAAPQTGDWFHSATSCTPAGCDGFSIHIFEEKNCPAAELKLSLANTENTSSLPCSSKTIEYFFFIFTGVTSRWQISW